MMTRTEPRYETELRGCDGSLLTQQQLVTGSILMGMNSGKGTLNNPATYGSREAPNNT